MEIEILLTKKQKEAIDLLRDKQTTELFYGGGAGGGKSFLGCYWLVLNCIGYPGTRYLMGRAVLKALKESTLNTFFQVCGMLGLKTGKDYRYNAIDGRLIFSNGSEVYLKDLFLYPRDPEFDSLGSTEYTGAFIDECSEITEKAKNIVMSRLRFKLKEYDLVPKLFMASNPTKNFAYREYWRPWTEGKLPDYRKFVPALVGDNPHMPAVYAENLLKLDKNSRERLLYGNWDYDDDPTRLFEYDEILQIFANEFETDDNDLPYLSVDVARFGSDQTVIIHWRGLKIIKIYKYDKTSTKDVREFIEKVAFRGRIPRGNIIIDEDGVGGGVVDETEGVKGFINNARALELKSQQNPSGVYTAPPAHNFANLKAQCYYLFAKAVKDGKIFCYKDINNELKDLIIQDLQQIKVKGIEKDQKWTILSKEEIKESLGRSPDFADALMMRMYFTLKKTITPYWSV